MDDLPFYAPLTAGNPGAAARKCRQHDWATYVRDNNGRSDLVYRVACRRCGAIRDEAAARRGRNNKKRGGRIQKARIEGLGGTNLLGNKPNHDGLGQMFSYESKSGGLFSERYWRFLTGIPVTADQTRVLIVTEAPGPGRKARSYVVVEYDEWKDIHGE